MSKKMTPEHPDYEANYQTLCIYCQRDFASFANLKRHIIRKHPKTYAYYNVAGGTDE